MIFNNLADINTIIFNGQDVQHLVYNGVTIWNKTSPAHDYSLDYLTFEVISGTSIGLVQVVQSGNLNKTVYYSKNDGNWQSVSTGGSISCTAGDIIRLKGNNNTYTNGNSSNYKSNYVYFNFGNSYVNVYGNIMSLLNGDDFAGTSLTSNQKYAFCSLFKQGTSTRGIVDASNLILPEGSQDGCFRAMFSTCKAMTAAPKQVKVTENGTATYVCYYMFEKCTSLTTTPELPTINYTSGKYLYQYMFTGCTALTSCQCYLIPTNNTSNMFRNITTTGTLYKNPDVTTFAGKPTNWTMVDAW